MMKYAKLMTDYEMFKAERAMTRDIAKDGVMIEHTYFDSENEESIPESLIELVENPKVLPAIFDGPVYAIDEINYRMRRLICRIFGHRKIESDIYGGHEHVECTFCKKTLIDSVWY